MHMLVLARAAFVLGLGALLLAGCESTPPAPPDDFVDLQGLWLVTAGPGTEYGSDGTTTLEFGSGRSGGATFLSESDANDIKTCERHVYASLAENVVLLDDEYYVATPSGDTIELSNDDDSLTLERIAGAGPVTPCEQVTATVIETLNIGVGGFSSLNSFQTRLYFNVDDPTDSIVAYDIATDSLGTARTYSDSVSGGTHRWVTGVRSDDLFYGHCGCGGSNSFDYYNLSTNTSTVSVETDTGLGINFSVRYGYFGGNEAVVGGRNRDDFTKNDLVTVNADTLALVSSRQILDEASIEDVALVDGRLLALVRDSIVVVGADGRAEETYEVNGATLAYYSGITGIGSTVYLLGATAADDVVLLEVELP